MEKRSGPLLSRRSRARPGGATEERFKATLDDIRRIIGVDAKPVAQVLPEAVAQATDERSAALAAALEPVVTRTIRVVASRESEWFGEILSPTIGAAVRKAVAAAFAALMQRFNEALERSISVQSFQWRLEARRTGRPFAEVVLLHTLVYRVEQVFLIHGETGLVLQHLAAEGAPSADPDQVASMLSAIDSFGREAFSSKTAGTYLHEFALGDLTVWIDRGPSVALAVVIRGVAPRRLLDVIAETRERILLEHRALLTSFVADISPFVATRPLLEQCLTEQRTEPRRRGPVILAIIVALVVASTVALAVSEHSRTLAEERQLAAYRQALESEPGILVTSAARPRGHYRFHGLRDPIAADPAALVGHLGQPAELSFEPFYSLDPRFTEKRFRRASGPPSSVAVRVEGTTLHLSGQAPRKWIDQALPLASALPGIERVDATVTDATAVELASATRALEAIEVRFDRESSRVGPALAPVIEQAAQWIERIRLLSAELGRETCVTVVGDADATGTARRNLKLAAERAATVLAAVREKRPRITEEMIRARPRDSSDVGPHTRSTRFHVRARSAATGCGEAASGD